MNEELKVIISAEIEKLKNGVNNAKKQIGNFKEQVKKASKDVEKNFAAIGQAATKAFKVVGTAIAGGIAALTGLSAATAEYRQNQAKLATAFEVAGGTAEQATKTYNDLYRVLGDDGQTTEAAAHLAKLTTEEQALSEWTTICTGVYATFGDSLPIEGLTEAANETAKTGVLTGGLADALNWAGISEEEFQAKLDACNTEAEREQLIRSTLNDTYGDAAALYEENAAAILAQNEAQANLQNKLAVLGEAMTPILTAFTNFGSNILAVITPYIQSLAETALPLLQSALQTVSDTLSTVMGYLADNWELVLTIAGVITGIALAIGLYNTVAAIKAAMDALQVTTVWGLVSAYAAQAAAMIVALAPYLLIIAAVAALVAGFLWLWENCEGFRLFWLDLWEILKTAFAAFLESIQPIWDNIVGAFKEAWAIIKIVWEVAKPFFEAIWNHIKTVFSVVGQVLSGFFKVAWELIKAAWSVVTSYFTNIWNTIKGIFSAVKSVLSGDFSAAWEAIKGVFSGWGSFFSGLWKTIVNTFKNIGSTVGSTISGVVKTAINGVLSTAVSIINGFINAINFAIGIINGIPGVSISTITPLTAPKMAKGGIVDGATLAVVGEAGAEAVMPLENNLQWLDKLAGMLNDRMGGNSGQPIILQVDGKTFAQTSIDSINQLTRQQGKLALNII